MALLRRWAGDVSNSVIEREQQIAQDKITMAEIIEGKPFSLSLSLTPPYKVPAKLEVQLN